MALLVRDTRVITVALRDGAPTIGPINSLVMSNAGGYFSESIDVGTFSEGVIFIRTSSHGGTNPTLDCDLQYSPDNKNFVDSGDSFTQITTTDGLFFKKMTANFGKYIRFRLKIGGTATPTYTVSMYIAFKS